MGLIARSGRLLQKEMATHQCFYQEDTIDRGGWWASPWGCKELGHNLVTGAYIHTSSEGIRLTDD